MAFRDLLGLTIDDHGDGTSVVHLTAGEEHLNPHGSVHGGALATLCDVAMGEAVVAAAGDDETPRPVTIEMKVTYLEPGQPGELVARAEVRKRGRRITIVETEVTQEDELVAHAIGTFTST